MAYEKATSNEIVDEKIRQLKPIHPEPAAVAERIHQVDLRETVAALILVDILKRFLRIHTLRGLQLTRP